MPVGEAPLIAMFEGAILPRLLAAHDTVPVSRPAAETRTQPVSDQVAALVPMAMQVEAGVLLDHAEALLRQGVSIDSLFVDFLAPAARQLGVLWEEDRCDFVDVTMGLWRLQEVVRELAARFPQERQPGGAKRALFAAMPGDQHSFGTVMVDETFRRHGWETDLALETTNADLLEQVGCNWFDVAGLTVSCDCHIDRATSLIRAIRSVSRNSRIIIMVGGKAFLENSMLAMEVGADGTAADAVQAVTVAGGLVSAVARELAASS